MQISYIELWHGLLKQI